MEKLHPNSLSFIFNETLYQLQESQIASETKTVLTEKEETKTTLLPPRHELKGTGKNRILIINNDSGHPFINQTDYGFLSKIISAIKQDLNECSLINIFGKKIKLNDLLSQTNAEKIICFNVNLFELGIQDKAPLKYELTQLANNTSIIASDSLGEISKITDKKKALWMGLQRMFNV